MLLGVEEVYRTHESLLVSCQLASLSLYSIGMEEAPHPSDYPKWEKGHNATFPRLLSLWEHNIPADQLLKEE